ncbi:flavin reductase family protein [Thermodesulfobacteriota bacterium]
MVTKSPNGLQSIRINIVPLPIAFISTVGEDGTFNAAPYSLVIPVSWQPPIICVSFGLKRGQKKDTMKNLEYSKCFVVNIMDENFMEPVVKAAIEYPSDVDEIKEIGLTALAADQVSSPRVAEAQVSLECRFMQKVEFGSGEKLRTVIFGEVLLIHVKDEVWTGDNIDPYRLKAVGRLSNKTYCRTSDIFKLKR